MLLHDKLARLTDYLQELLDHPPGEEQSGQKTVWFIQVAQVVKEMSEIIDQMVPKSKR